MIIMENRMSVDKTAPVELEKCWKCGGSPRLHHSRSGKWYVRCTACKEKNKTEESTSRLMICKAWNLRNRTEKTA